MKHSIPPLGFTLPLLLLFSFGPFALHSAIVARPNGTIYGTYLSSSRPAEFSRLHYMIFDQTNTAIVQAQSDADNHTIVTVNSHGDFQVWFYANDFLGYVEPNTSTLLYCQPLTVSGQEQPLLDAWPRSDFVRLESHWVYPGTTQRIVGPRGVLYNADGSILYNEAGRWLYKVSRREVDLPAGSYSRYDDREDYFSWHNGTLINNPVTKDRNYMDGSSLVDPTPDPIITPIDRPLRYEGGALFATGLQAVQYVDGAPVVIREPGRFLIKYPVPYGSINLADIRPGPFAQFRYSNNDVLKQDIALANGQLRRTDGTPTTEIANSFGFPGGVSLYVSASTNRDFVAIYREQPNSVAAFFQVRQSPTNRRNLRLLNLTESSVTVAWDPDPEGNNIFHLSVFPRGTFGSDCAGPDITDFTRTVSGLAPDTHYTIQLCQLSPFTGFFYPTSTLDPVSTKLLTRFEQGPSPSITAIANSYGDRYRLESAANLNDWIPAYSALTASSGGYTLRWPLGTPDHHHFFRIKKLTPFDTE
ncbi:MAG TPA: hypothetical protein VF773_00235 [Verrucomicrobiae bacterium]